MRTYRPSARSHREHLPRQVARRHGCRRAQVAVDYVLVLGTLLPLCGILLMLGRKIIMLAYEMIGGMISWPFV